MKLGVEEYRLDVVSKVLSEETLSCPPPFSFGYDSEEETKDCPAKDRTEKNPCAECWKRWLLGEY